MKKLCSAFFIASILFLASCGSKNEDHKRPNIVWITLEDWGYQLSCYGEPGVNTPFIDRVRTRQLISDRWNGKIKGTAMPFLTINPNLAPV
jgi:hypothetical protein